MKKALGLGRGPWSLAIILLLSLGLPPGSLSGAAFEPVREPALSHQFVALEDPGGAIYPARVGEEKQPAGKERYKAGEVLVKFKPSLVVSPALGTTTSPSINSTLRRYGLAAMQRLFEGARKPTAADTYRAPGGKAKAAPDLSAIYRLRFPPSQDPAAIIEELSRDPAVEYAEPNYLRWAITTPNDPYYSSTGSWGQPYADMWGLRRIDGGSAWDVVTGTTSLVVAVVDTGVDPNHPDLVGKLVPGWDFFNNDADPRDDNGHGTHVAGTIAAATNNGIGVAGLCWECKIMPLKTFGSTGSGPVSALAQAVRYAADNGAKVINNSWGGPGYSNVEVEAFRYAYSRGAVLVAAAGNDGNSASFYPAAFPEVIAVSATNPNDNPAWFTNYGSYIAVAAPGEDILSLRAAGIPASYYRYVVGSNYGVLSGTSMATPHVSGLAGLILSRNPGWTPTQVRCAITSAAEDLGAPGWDQYYGSGLIDAYAAVQLDSCTDATPPGARLLSPNGGEAWLVGSVQPINWIAGDGMGVDRVDLALSTNNGATWSNLATGLPNSGTYAFTVPNTPTEQALTRVTAYDAQSNAASDTSDAVFRIVVPDLSSSRKTVSSTTVSAGNALTYTVTLTDASGAGLSNVSVADPIPADTIYVVGSATGGATYNGALNRIEWSRGPGSYIWTDSDQPGGPPYTWVDIRGSGTAVGGLGDDISHGPFDVGFGFPFYGSYFNQFYICDNGFLTFSRLAPWWQCPYSNSVLPIAGAPSNLVAPFWDDLYPVGGGSIYYWSNGVDTLIVSWVGVPHYWSGGPYTFQAILKKDGSITYQYNSMGAPTDSATVGIQNGGGSQGLQVAYNQTYVHNSLATRISPPATSATFSFAVSTNTGLAPGTVITNTAVISDGFTTYSRSVTTTVTSAAPTAVTLSRFGASAGGGGWPWPAAVLGGLVAALGGAAFWRRRNGP